ncbi:hypothetical protein BY457_1284 [Marinilabilia salmonicolor]|jgi:hypothetical protein|nr:hypothetical protein [Marinilabilia salmonicolor]PRY89997.1 hypothetical protein BY457_1284 [Marinilabilia salmonicolor]
MQKFDGPSWVNNRKATDCYTVDDVDAYFPLADYETPPEQKKSHDSVFWTPGTINNWEDISAIQQWKSYYDNVEAIEENPDERDEVFFCLHDPLGCADELGIELQNKWNFMEALIVAMQTGLDRYVTLKEIVKGAKNPENVGSKDLIAKAKLMH